ncbi:MAG: hypothetical protein JWR76_526, partial [Mucilaginibacter sp.]|nr:hypothetical protein [Mucilaginibacter sp.]
MKHVAIIFICIFLSAGFYARAQSIKNDSITIAVAPEYDKVSKLHRTLFGENYRKLWAVPVK